MAGIEMKKRERNALMFILGFIVVIIYARTLFGGFIYDDNYYIRDNPAIRSLSDWPRFFTDPQTAVASPEQALLIYRPLTTAFFAVEYALLGTTHPLPWHIVSIALFLFLIGLLAGLAGSLIEGYAPEVLACVFVAVHPLAAESVGWLSAQPTLLCATSLVLSLSLFRFTRETLRPYRRWIYAASLAAAGAAMFFKEPGIVAPLLLWLFRPDAENRDDVAAQRRTVAASALFAVGYLALRMKLLGGMGSSFLYGGTWVTHFASFLSIVPRYVARLVLPVHLRVFYDLPQPTVLTVVSGAVFLTAPVAGWIWLRRSRPAAALGFAFAWLTYLPSSNFLPTGMPTAERFFFLPLIGLSFVAADFARPFLRRPRINAALPVLVAAGCLFALLTFERNKIWGSPKRFWQRAVLEQPRLPLGYYNLALVHSERGEPAEAEMNYRKALELDPRDGRIVNSLGAVLARQNRFDEAESLFRRALELNKADAGALDNLVRLLMTQSRIDEAVHIVAERLVKSPSPAIERVAVSLLASGFLTDEQAAPLKGLASAR